MVADEKPCCRLSYRFILRRTLQSYVYDDAPRCRIITYYVWIELTVVDTFLLMLA